MGLISGMCLTLGILTTGGSIFIVLYNSCPIWTTLLSRLFLNKFSLPWISLAGICLVTLGLILNNIFVSQLTDQNEKEEAINEPVLPSSSSRRFNGSIIILVGSVLHSLMFVLSDITLRPPCSAHSDKDSSVVSSLPRKNRNQIEKSGESRENAIYHEVIPSGFMWSFCLGSIEASVMLVWVLVNIVLYGFRDEDYQSAMTGTGYNYDGNSSDDDILHIDIFRFLLGFVLLLVTDCIHAATFFSILQNIGAVGSALLKGVQLIAVVVLSSIFFCCPSDESQCLTHTKSYSVTFVLLGVLCYGIGNSSVGHDGKGECHHIQQKKSTTNFKTVDDCSERKSDTKEIELESLL